MSQSTILAQGTINGAYSVTIELIQPADHPPIVRVVWPTAPTITTPVRYLEVASTAMRLLAEASTAAGCPRVRSGRPCNPTGLVAQCHRTWGSGGVLGETQPCDVRLPSHFEHFTHGLSFTDTA